MEAGVTRVREARLEKVESGLAPATEGWFVVNVRDAAWLVSDDRGGACVFEADAPGVRGRPDLEAQKFADLGFKLAVLEPGQPSGMYHAESNQEDFLVLAGECTLIVEDEERRLQAWDFVHCPPETAHVFIGAGDGSCVIFMVGARSREKTIVYPRSEIALRYGAGVETETTSAAEAYAHIDHWTPGRPSGWDILPWSPS